MCSRWFLCYEIRLHLNYWFFTEWTIILVVSKAWILGLVEVTAGGRNVGVHDLPDGELREFHADCSAGTTSETFCFTENIVTVMTSRPSSTFWSNSYGFGILQAWTMSLLLVCTGSNSDRFCDNRANGSFDYFYFVQQWPGAFCTRGCCFASNLPLPAARFGIHGLWPVHFEGTGPCFCSSTKFGKISPELERSLQKHWVAMQCPNYPNMLYMHGWKKHGICSGMQQAYYFQTAIQLHAKYNILQTFKDAGISFSLTVLNSRTQSSSWHSWTDQPRSLFQFRIILLICESSFNVVARHSQKCWTEPSLGI